MSDTETPGPTRRSAIDVVRPLIRVRQVREFTDEPIDAAALEAITDVARWSGSGRNSQPWRFIVIGSVPTIRSIAEAGLPQTRALRTAMAAVAIVMPAEPGAAAGYAYDEGRVAERILIAATFLGLGAGIAWVRSDVRESVAPLLGLPQDRFVRSVMAIGHPTESARRPKSPPGMARLPRSETVFAERWPAFSGR